MPLVVLWTQVSISNGFWDIQRRMKRMVDVTLIRSPNRPLSRLAVNFTARLSIFAAA